MTPCIGSRLLEAWIVIGQSNQEDKDRRRVDAPRKAVYEAYASANRSARRRPRLSPERFVQKVATIGLRKDQCPDRFDQRRCNARLGHLKSSAGHLPSKNKHLMPR
jgi:hypothetical protein